MQTTKISSPGALSFTVFANLEKKNTSSKVSQKVKTTNKQNQRKNFLTQNLVKLVNCLEKKHISIVQIGIIFSILGNLLSCSTALYSMFFKKRFSFFIKDFKLKIKTKELEIDDYREIINGTSQVLSKVPADLLCWDLLLVSTEKFLRKKNLGKFFSDGDDQDKEEQKKKEELAIALLCYLLGLLSNEFIKPIFKFVVLKDLIKKSIINNLAKNNLMSSILRGIFFLDRKKQKHLKILNQLKLS